MPAVLGDFPQAGVVAAGHCPGRAPEHALSVCTKALFVSGYAPEPAELPTSRCGLPPHPSVQPKALCLHCTMPPCFPFGFLPSQFSQGFPRTLQGSRFPFVPGPAPPSAFAFSVLPEPYGFPRTC